MSLPNEIFYTILINIPHGKLQRLQSVCVLFCNILNDEYFWKEKFHKDFKLQEEKLSYQHPIYQGLTRYNYQLYLSNIQRGSEKYVPLNDCLEIATLRKKYLLMQYFLDIGASRNFNSLYVAAKTYDRMALSLLIAQGCLTDEEKGAIITGALYGKHDSLFEEYVSLLDGKINMEYAFYHISTKGSLSEVSSLMKKIGLHENLDIVNYESGLIGAVESGNMSLIEVYINIGANNIHEAAKASIICNRMDVFKYFLNNYPSQIDVADLYYTATTAQPGYLDFLLSWDDDLTPLSTYNLFCGFLEAGDLGLAKYIEKKINLESSAMLYGPYETMDKEFLEGATFPTRKAILNLALYKCVMSVNPFIIEHYVSEGAIFHYVILQMAIESEKIDLLQIILYMFEKYPSCRPPQKDWIRALQGGFASNNKTFYDFILDVYLDELYF